MQPSQLQLQELVYLSIKVAGRKPVESEIGDTPFDFNGVHIAEGVDMTVIDENKANPKHFALRFHIAFENDKGKAAPYDLDIEVAGVFSIISDMPVSERENFVRVNGCSVLYSAIRDQVLTLTSRSSRGALMLPTVNFLDYRHNQS